MLAKTFFRKNLLFICHLQQFYISLRFQDSRFLKTPEIFCPKMCFREFLPFYHFVCNIQQFCHLFAVLKDIDYLFKKYQLCFFKKRPLPYLFSWILTTSFAFCAKFASIYAKNFQAQNCAIVKLAIRRKNRHTAWKWFFSHIEKWRKQ